MNPASEPPDVSSSDAGPTWVLWLAVLLYFGLRLLAMFTAPELEDHDSAGYLINADLLLSADWEGIRQLGADHTPLYPVLIAAVAATGIGIEMAARIVSFAFSGLLLLAFIRIGRYFATRLGVAIGVILMAVCPLLVELSVSVLSEPTYVGLVYLGAWLVWEQLRRPGLAIAFGTGAVLGLAFLDRIEGLIFLGAIPALWCVAGFARRRSERWTLGDGTRWIGAYILAFLLLATPQVWWVSERMGGFAINGRQVWSLVENQHDSRPRQERMWGLDYSPSEPNLFYLQSHPEARAEVASGVAPAEYVRLAAYNVDSLYWGFLGDLVGPGVLALFLFGLVDLWRRRLAPDLILILGFLGSALVAPLLHAALDTRHLAVLAPVLFLVAGQGATLLAVLLGSRQGRAREWFVPLTIAAAVAVFSLVPVRLVALRGSMNPDYDPESLVDPARMIQEIEEAELDGPAVLVSLQYYLAQAAGVRRPRVFPYTDLDGLIRYLMLNRADFLFVEYQRLEDLRPLSADFLEQSLPPELSLLYQGETSGGERLELYRVNSAVNGVGE